MSKATNNTQRVTFGKARATCGFRSERTIFLDGHNVGTIEKEGKNCGYNVSIRMEDEEGSTVRAFDRCFDIEHDGIRYDNPSIALRQAKGYVLEVLASAQVARTHVKACGNAGFSWVEIAEEPAQADETELDERSTLIQASAWAAETLAAGRRFTAAIKRHGGGDITRSEWREWCSEADVKMSYWEWVGEAADCRNDGCDGEGLDARAMAADFAARAKIAGGVEGMVSAYVRFYILPIA
tara:strand:- start:30 stop:746 length:717 start_codon:yes stop_codon:yes gene_type:complete